MSNTKQEPSNNKWLRKLQQESWQLELLISGFSIFLLIKSIEWLSEIIDKLNFHFENDIGMMMLVFFIVFIKLSTFVFVVNLVIHLFLRGFWVGSVGLGSVAPNTDIKRLKYSDYFNKRIEKKIQNLDVLVNSIDKISSLIFSFTFLVMFYIISFGLYFVFIGLFTALLIYLSSISPNSISFVYFVLFLFVFSTGLLYIIDFFFFGILRKNKIISKIYYPIYWFYNTITLSFIYRTIYYNLITRFSKRKMALILIPYLLIIIIIASFSIDDYQYFPDNKSEYSIDQNFYSSLRRDNSFIKTADIPSQIVKDDFLPLFIRYDVDDNDSLRSICPDIVPQKKRIKSIFQIQKTENDLSFHIKSPPEVIEKHPEKILTCLSSFYDVYLNDTLCPDLKFYLHTHNNKGENGIITMLDVSVLDRGENKITVYKKSLERQIATIYFWLEK